MGKVILASLLAGSLGGAALVTVGQTYYSTAFQWSFPLQGGGFKVTPDLGNVWHWEGDVPPIQQGGSVAVMIDFNGDGVMDNESSDVRVCITDIQNVSGSPIDIVDSTGVRWNLQQRGAAERGDLHLITPIVLPIGSSLQLRLPAGAQTGGRVRLIGRIVNI